jgi:hypothetical protein
MAFATGRYVRYGYFGHGFEEDDVVGMVPSELQAQVPVVIRSRLSATIRCLNCHAQPSQIPLQGFRPLEEMRKIVERVLLQQLK